MSKLITITIDGRSLPHALLIIGQSSWLSNTESHEVGLLPGQYQFQAGGSAVASSWSFTVTPQGSVDFDPACDGFLSGRGSATLRVHGYPITIDGQELPHPLLLIGESVWLPHTQVNEVRMIPASGYQFQAGGSAVAKSWSFTVTPQGSVDFDPACDGFLSGRGSATLRVHGYPITIDGQELPHPLLLIGESVWLPHTQVNEVRMIPASWYQFQAGGSEVDTNWSFTVTLQGSVDFDPAYNQFLDGRGTTTLTITPRVLGDPSSLLAVDPDGPRSAALLNLTDNLTGVFAAGAAHERFAVGVAGEVSLTWRRDPLVLIALEQDLMLEELRVDVALTVPGDTPDVGSSWPVTPVRFAPFSERGAMLAVWPQTGAGGAAATGLHLALTAQLVTESGSIPVPATELAGRVSVVLGQGTLGRLLYLCGAEKAGIRRAAREIAAARVLGSARRASLDRHGADLGVVGRFADVLTGTAGTPPQVYTHPRPAGAYEDDADYRRRLAAMRTFSLPTAGGVQEAINGDGDPADPPRGWLADLATGAPGQHRIRLVERVRPFSVGVMLVSAAATATEATAARRAFAEQMRQDRLVLPTYGGATTATYAGRLLPDGERTRLDDLGATLRAAFTFIDGPQPAALAPGLAQCLALVAQCRAALRDTAAPWRVVRTQDVERGGPYELALAADVVIPPADGDALAQLLAHWQPPVPAAAPVVTTALLAAQAEGTGGVPALLRACGLATVRSAPPDTAGATTLSHLLLVDLAGEHDVAVGGASHVGAFGTTPAAAQLVVTADAATGALTIFSLDARGTRTLAAEGSFPTGDDVAVLRDPADPSRVGRVVLASRATGEAHVVDVVRAPEGNVTATASSTLRSLPPWTQLVPLRLGTAAAVALYDRASESLALRLVDAELPASVLTGVGRWTRLFALPAVGGDELACYDAVTGDVQVLKMTTAGDGRVRASTRWRREAWRPGLTLVEALPGGRVVGVDRDLGRVELWTCFADGVPSLAAGHLIGPRRVTHLAVLPASPITGPDGVLLAYDRSRGTATLWRDLGPDAAPLRPDTQWHEPPNSISVEARLGDAGGRSVLDRALDDAAVAWTAAGHPAWELHRDAAQRALWTAADASGLTSVLTAVGLAVAGPAADFAPRAEKVPDDEVATLRIDAATGAQWTQGKGRALALDLVAALSGRGLAAAVALLGPGEARPVVVVSTRGLPLGGLNLSGQRTSGISWHALPVTGLPAALDGAGPARTVRPADVGVSVLVAVGFQGSGLADPYQVRLELPPGATLGLDQYEFLMNVVERAVPAGIEANTFAIRRRHLDVDGDGAADPLPIATARVFRRFRSSARRGVPGAR